ncbi:hypothetical protein AWB81_03323 [Caballeronia arationis]|jgi:hypothetical protein|uniref:Cytochrome c domain-containing protein n=1 Tax=Caballeronia arationis TaxID=1777142 RepID=A0A7Z7ICS3_9BURK|nr:hypothetical protein [Caballeronia arationis]SAK73080.1 hypothetical protein AWB81_03323 [Caballeronia arationis]SOE88189.1 hypothetical protein SAMN05446927_6786 [Caballeronia arationis]
MAASQSRRQAARLAICLALAALARLAHADQQPCKPDDLGCAIYNGQHAVAAHLRDDDRPLPAWTTRCANCHAGTDKSGIFAPPLTPSYLLDAETRRGGPASRYQPTSFCRAVKDGIDPANVLLRKAMPHYQISDSECAALWGFLTNR